MQEKKDKIKLAIWICSGILLGAVLTLAVQHFLPSSARADASAQVAAKNAENSEETISEASSGQAAVATPPAAVASASSKYESPTPVSNALAVLNNGSPVSAPAEQAGMNLAPGTSYSETASGYPIVTGGRAIDSPPAYIPAPMQVIGGQGVVLSTSPEQNLAPQPVGRNGLLANPCSDPSSVHGLAYRNQLQ